MSHNFLIDENLVIPGGDYEVAAISIWLGVRGNCHRVCLDHLLYVKYLQKLDGAGGKGLLITELSSALVRTIRDVLVDSDKLIFVVVQGPSPLAGMVRDEDDRFLADVAHAVIEMAEPPECILITSDVDTLDDFNAMGQAAVSAVSPSGGVVLAEEKCA